MNITYNGETQSLTYATPSESDASSRLRVYPVSGFVECNQWCRSLYWRRIILATSLLLSLSAFSISLITFIHLTNTEIHDNTGQPEHAKYNQIIAAIKDGDSQSTVPDVHTVRTSYQTEVADFSESGSGDSSDNISTTYEDLKDFLLQHSGQNKAISGKFLEILCHELDTLKSALQESIKNCTRDEFTGCQTAVTEDSGSINSNNTVRNQATVSLYDGKEFGTGPSANGTNAQEMESLQNKTENVIKELNNIKYIVYGVRIESNAKMRNESLLLLRGYEEFVNSSLRNAKNHYSGILTSTRRELAQTNRTTKILMQQMAGLIKMKENLSKLQLRVNRLEEKISDDSDVDAMSQHFLQDIHRALGSTDSDESTETGEKISIAAVKKLLSGKADWGWIQAPNGYAYQATPQTFASWGSAKIKCQQLNSTLAYVGVRSNTMKKFIFSLLIEPRGENVWIGLSDLGKEGTWKWLDGRQLSQFPTNWAPTQPNNLFRDSHDQDCAEIDKVDGKWNDVWCMSSKNNNIQNAALCERKIYPSG